MSGWRARIAWRILDTSTDPPASAMTRKAMGWNWRRSAGLILLRT
jgi:hypothetical protein